VIRVLTWPLRLIAAAWRRLTARRGRTTRTAYTPGPGDRLIRWGTAAVVLAVAGFAAVVSYSHIYDLGRAHGQAGAAARLLPLSVDGLILAAGLVLTHAARAGLGAPVLARLMLWLGIGATVGANVEYGVRFGVLGAVISAWPAVAFIGSAEMGVGMIRSARSVAAPAPGTAAETAQEPRFPIGLELAGAVCPWPATAPPAPEADTPVPGPVPAVPEPPAALNGTGHAALELFAAELAAGSVPSVRRVRREMHLGQPRAQQVQEYLSAALTSLSP
jgi:hypothetical protein